MIIVLMTKSPFSVTRAVALVSIWTVWPETGVCDENAVRSRNICDVHPESMTQELDFAVTLHDGAREYLV